MNPVTHIGVVLLDRTSGLRDELAVNDSPTKVLHLATLHQGDEAVVRVELPGLDPNSDVHIRMDHEFLHVTAVGRDRAGSTSSSDHSDHVPFEQTIQLPTGIDPDCVSALYRHNILEIRFPCTWKPHHERAFAEFVID